MNTETKTVEHVNAENFASLIKQGGAQLIDVRTSGEFFSGHLKGATNIDIMSYDFTQKMDELNKSIPVLVYCRSGSRSASAGEYLISRGFEKVVNLAGGMLSWPFELE